MGRSAQAAAVESIVEHASSSRDPARMSEQDASTETVKDDQDSVWRITRYHPDWCTGVASWETYVSDGEADFHDAHVGTFSESTLHAAAARPSENRQRSSRAFKWASCSTCGSAMSP